MAHTHPLASSEQPRGDLLVFTGVNVTYERDSAEQHFDAMTLA